MCLYCEGHIDNAEHRLTGCTGWETERESLKEALDGPVSLDGVVEAICADKEKWQMVNNFATKVMSRKEEDERREKQKTTQETREERAGERTENYDDEERDSTQEEEEEERENEGLEPEDEEERDHHDDEEDETWDPGG